MMELNEKRLVLGLSGGIACYKAAELCRLLIKQGASVQVVMTEAAAQFITRVRRQTRRLVADWTGIYQYTVDQVLEDMITRSRQLKLRLAVPEEQARQEFIVLLTVQTMNYLHSGRHRLAL